MANTPQFYPDPISHNHQAYPPRPLEQAGSAVTGEDKLPFRLAGANPDVLVDVSGALMWIKEAIAVRERR